jgi:hypothetical protein
MLDDKVKLDDNVKSADGHFRVDPRLVRECDKV